LKIEIIDPTVCKVIEDREELAAFLSITEEKYFKKGKDFGKTNYQKEVSLVDKEGFFLAGWLPRILKRFPDTKIIGEEQKLKFNKKIDPPGITLFDDQRKQILPALEKQRGIIKAPTGTGKTVLLYALANCFKTKKVLILFPLEAIFSQTVKDFKEWGANISEVKAGKKDLSGQIVLAMDKSFKNITAEDYCGIFDVVLIDEAHHVSTLDGTYHKILTQMLAPVRIGVTASPHSPKTNKGVICEGLLGPIISEFTIEEAVKNKRLATPTLKLISVPKNSNTKELYTYKDIYYVSVVKNSYRNSLIADYLIKKVVPNKETAIVFTYMIKHAEALQETLVKKGIKSKIVHGDIKKNEREIIKTQLERKEIDCVIATAAWKEGLNVKSLNTIINAAGYKDGNPVVQMAGRCLRIIPGEKEKATVVDFLDLGKYLSEHSIQRLQTYQSLGWIE